MCAYYDIFCFLKSPRRTRPLVNTNKWQKCPYFSVSPSPKCNMSCFVFILLSLAWLDLAWLSKYITKQLYFYVIRSSWYVKSSQQRMQCSKNAIYTGQWCRCRSAYYFHNIHVISSFSVAGSIACIFSFYIYWCDGGGGSGAPVRIKINGYDLSSHSQELHVFALKLISLAV